jgi:hypothetical protein
LTKEKQTHSTTKSDSFEFATVLTYEEITNTLLDVLNDISDFTSLCFFDGTSF